MQPLAITCGDPCGIGPEVTIKAIQAVGGDVPCVWFGDPNQIPAGVDWRYCPDDFQVTPDSILHVRPHVFETIPVLGTAEVKHATNVVGILNTATDLCLNGHLSGLVTGPINKKILQDGAGFSFPGHTEFLADKSGCDFVVMMLACDSLRVVPLTIHVPLADVPALVTADLIEQTAHVISSEMHRKYGIKNPHIAVAGLNPHASEGGNIGRNDIDIVAPAIAKLKAQGMNISGPYPADTMFHATARAGYDVALCMYHDQALIPIKTIDFAGGVNVTLGLPFVRTSPDHGTAFDIAGQGKADPTSTINAIKMAWGMIQNAN